MKNVLLTTFQVHKGDIFRDGPSADAIVSSFIILLWHMLTMPLLIIKDIVL